jgi:hypothetical protein
MKKIKTIQFMLVITGCLLFMSGNVFAVDIHDTQLAAMTKEEYKAYKAEKSEKQRALAHSKRPEVVGEDILEQEADGMYMLPQQALDNWGNGRMFPDYALVKGK